MPGPGCRWTQATVEISESKLFAEESRTGDCLKLNHLGQGGAILILSGCCNFGYACAASAYRMHVSGHGSACASRGRVAAAHSPDCAA